MKKPMFRSEANRLTIIENTFVIIMFLIIVMVSIPSLKLAILELFSSPFQSSSTSSSVASRGFIGWIPPELSKSDNKVVYSNQDISMSMEAKITGNTASNLGTSFRFPLPLFPQFPYGTLPSRGVITPEDATVPLMISENGYFESITLQSSLFINTGERGDIREIIVDHLDLGSRGKIILIGKGQLKLYVRTRFIFSDSSSINADGSPDSLVMYYQGTEALSITDGTQVFVGSIYAQGANLTISGGRPSIKGSVIIGGTSVGIENTSFRGIQFLLYAPEAKVSISGDPDIEGKLIVKQLIGSGNTTIRYLPLNILGNFRWKD